MLSAFITCGDASFFNFLCHLKQKHAIDPKSDPEDQKQQATLTFNGHIAMGEVGKSSILYVCGCTLHFIPFCSIIEIQ